MLKNLIAPYLLLWHHKKSALLILLADLFFFLSFAFVFALLQERLAEVFLGISQLFASASIPSGVG